MKEQLDLMVNTSFEVLIEMLNNGSNPLSARFLEKIRPFPHGCCMNTSALLANVLYNLHNIKPSIVTDNANQHWYLEYKGYIIDLTAKQFDKSLPDVLIIKTCNKPSVLDFGPVHHEPIWNFKDNSEIKKLQIKIEEKILQMRIIHPVK